MLNDNMDFVRIFEDKLAAWTGFDFAVTTDCCTNALLLSFEALRIGGIVDKSQMLRIPSCTYMSVPMTLFNNGWQIMLDDAIQWTRAYQINIKSERPIATSVWDSAVDFRENMADDYPEDSIVCVSFQQKKRLSLGRGGAILVKGGLKNLWMRRLLCRLRYDGRDTSVSDRVEVTEYPNDIICGYHCYMEPDKAAKGILLLNQPAMLPPYAEKSFADYANLMNIEGLFKKHE